MRTWAAVIVVVGMVSGCKFGSTEFHCTSDVSCSGGGFCEVNGFCSFADTSCDSGRRFSDLSGGLSGSCVGGGPPIDSGLPVDARPDAPPDARMCFGTAPFTICLAAAPTAPLMVSQPTTIDTTSSPMCEATISGGANYCVVAATTIAITAKLRGIGSKPLVLLASDSITIGATIDIGSHRGASFEIGAGADPAVCPAGSPPVIGGGGAGGSFTGVGGAGGASALAGSIGGAPGAAVTPAVLRGGCPGQDGQGAGADKGFGGHGGGAVLLIAVNSITINGGGINAAGEGGQGGAQNTSGGGGGGAGGMIVLDALTITSNGLLIANGGGGGEGSGTTTAGTPGSDPTGTTAALGGSGGSGIGGDGGNGSSGAAGGPGANGKLGTIQMTSNGGGGAGGGGAGLIKAPATATLGTLVSPLSTP